MVLSILVLPPPLYKETILNNRPGMEDVYFCLGLKVYSYCLTIKDIIGKAVKLIYTRAKRV